ncbi:virulence factor [Gallibacterium genomosp. 3]|uniref:Virulence factor n=1 Tax=Gallibacterium genomosp. 3 TaxID=505345 RepID=A0A1A7PP86_9PAST|nr:SrfA family protein [Gallibacterium genomosp. 3]OBX03527.1 virulence factor [Gallibacterium genomosp. 3]
MLSALLRSGDIKNYTALGQDGTPVYAVASQLRDAIRLRVKDQSGDPLGKKFANYLAIPQRNDQGSQIDWYVPFESDRADGKYLIIPWTSATEEERNNSYQELHLFEQSMLEFGQKLKNTNNIQGDLLLFSRLLSGNNNSADINDPENLKALRFPNPEHVYLVNGKPVITFWGFVEKNSPIHGHPFLSLKPIEKPLITTPIEEPILAQPVTAEPSKPWWRWLLCLLPFLLIGALSLFFLRSCWSPSVELPSLSFNTENTKTPQNNTERQVCLDLAKNAWFYVDDGTTVTDSSLIQQLNTSKNKNSNQCQTVAIVDSVPRVISSTNTSAGLPTSRDGTDTISPTQNEPIGKNTTDTVKEESLTDNPQKDATQPVMEDPQPKTESPNQETNKDATDNKKDPNISQNQDNNTVKPEDTLKQQSTNQPLQIPTESLQKGNVDFLNGKWNAGAGIQDKSTGKPLRLKYEFEKGKGQVRVERGDGVQCVGQVNASIQGTSLNIGNTGIANCSDGSTYQLPNVSCKPSANGSADCEGEYGKGQNFPMSMKSE